MSIWVNKYGDLLILHGETNRGYLFETELDIYRVTALHPQEWGWEIVDLF